MSIKFTSGRNLIKTEKIKKNHQEKLLMVNCQCTDNQLPPTDQRKKLTSLSGLPDSLLRLSTNA